MPDLEYEDNPVIENWLRVQTGSLAELLCRQAFEDFRLSRMPYRSNWALPHRRENAVAVTESAAAELGYNRLWYSSSFSGYFEREESAFSVSQSPLYAMALQWGANNDSYFVPLKNRLLSLLPLEMLRS